MDTGNLKKRKIPVVDIRDCHDPSVIRRIDNAFHSIGFLIVEGHGIPRQLFKQMRAKTIAYFSQATRSKLGDSITRDNYRGYIPLGFFSANSGEGEPDRYEGYKLHFEVAADDPVCKECPLYGPNLWPANPPGFRRTVLDYWQACDGVCATLLGVLARIMEIDPANFLEKFEKPLTNMTLLHYPPVAEGTDAFGIHPHKDTDALTLLHPDPVGGLMLRRRDDKDWLEVKAPANSLVVNIGDLLEIWSGGYFISTPHKVVNLSGEHRYSYPYFAVPRHDVLVSPLVPEQAGFDRPPVPVGDVSREVWRTNWPDAVPKPTGYELGTLDD